jgi:hypothetical protein
MNANQNNFRDNPDDFIKDKQQLFEISEKNKKLCTFINAVTEINAKGNYQTSMKLVPITIVIII